MADVFCPHCGEPWDADEFHNGTDSYSELRLLFRRYGCPVAEQAIDGLSASEIRESELIKCNRAPIVDNFRLDAIQIMGELAGDDFDAESAFLSDWL